jgi:hypothetical protein
LRVDSIDQRSPSIEVIFEFYTILSVLEVQENLHNRKKSKFACMMKCGESLLVQISEILVEFLFAVREVTYDENREGFLPNLLDISFFDVFYGFHFCKSEINFVILLIEIDSLQNLKT